MNYKRNSRLINLKKCAKRIVSISCVLSLALTLGFGTTVEYSDAASKVSIEKAKITLSERQIQTTGKVCAPKVKSVVITKNGKQKTVPKSAYTISYQRESGKEIKYVKRAGTYKLIVTAKDSSNYQGSCSATFTVVGTPQEILIEDTELHLSVNPKNTASGVKEMIPDYTLNPGATGDGTGFTFTSNNKEMVKVDKEGNLYCLKKGKTTVMINTKGDLISQPASIRIIVYIQ